MAKTKTKVSNKKLPAAEKRLGTESWKWVVGILLSIAAIIIPYHEWKTDRAPAIRYVDYQLLGTPGQTVLNFQSHYRNVGKTDATEVTMESRLFTAGHYDPSLQGAESFLMVRGSSDQE